MNTMMCHDVEEQLELLAAGECDASMSEAIRRHLAQCPTCAASSAASRRLQGLLHLQWNDSGLDRLRNRIELEERRSRRPYQFAPSVRRVAALAAMVLVAAGLIWVLSSWRSSELLPELQLAAVALPDAGTLKAVPANIERHIGDTPAASRSSGGVALTLTLAPSETGDGFRRELTLAQHDVRLPPPTPVPLALDLSNGGKRAVNVRIGGPGSELSLDVKGDGVVRIPASRAATPAFLEQRSFELEPGQHHEIRIDRLIAGAPGEWEYIYLTEPGEYALRARLRIVAGGSPVTINSGIVRITALSNR
jgi:hypothetical protein